MTSTAAPGPPHRPARAGRPAPGPAASRALLLVLSGNMLLDAVEVSLVLVALPTVGAAFGVGLPSVQWLMSGFAAGFAGTLLLGPWITARYGRRRTYLIAMAVFAAASVAGGLSGSLAVLVATRVVKGACAALTAPAGLAIIAAVFPPGPAARRAVSVYSWFGAAGFTIGVLLAGALLEAHWRWVFLAPAPAAAVLLVLAARLLPADLARPPSPSWPPGLLGNRLLMRSVAGAAALNGTYQSVLVLFVAGAGWAPWRTALALLPACLPLALTAPLSSRVVARTGTPVPIAAGALAALLGCLYYLWRPAGAGYAVAALPALLLIEVAFVLSFAALNMQATEAVAAGARGYAVPLYQTGVQAGAVLLLPLVCVAAARYGDRPALVPVAVVAAAGAAVAVAGLMRSTLPQRSVHG